MPSLEQVVNPKGDGGAAIGYVVPLRPEAGKSDLQAPMTRGLYAASSLDRKTVLKFRVMSKEEVGFDPIAVLESPIGATLSPAEKDCVRSTWTIVQLTFESYDPEFFPALDLFHQIAGRLARLTDGIVADPLAERYLTADMLVPVLKETFDVRQLVSVKSAGGGRVQTMGLAKLALPEILLTLVPPELEQMAAVLLLSVAAETFSDRQLKAGDHFKAGTEWIVAEQPGIGVSGFELLPVEGSVADALLALKS